MAYGGLKDDVIDDVT